MGYTLFYCLVRKQQMDNRHSKAVISRHHINLISRLTIYSLTLHSQLPCELIRQGIINIWSKDGEWKGTHQWGGRNWIPKPLIETDETPLCNEKKHWVRPLVEKNLSINLISYGECRIKFEQLFPYYSLRTMK